jgi:hypothetical protein
MTLELDNGFTYKHNARNSTDRDDAMKIRAKPELPGDVLVALRECEGFRSHREFAETLPLSHHTLWRLEKVTWGSDPDTWERTVGQADIEVLVQENWIKKNDDWWQRFRTAFAWQHIVKKYGKAIYEGEDGSALHILEPVHEEHVLTLVEAVVQRTVARYADADRADVDVKALTDRVYGEVVFRLATTGLLAAQETPIKITPEFERTRTISDLFTSPIETPYTRTLLLAYEWAAEVAAG